MESITYKGMKFTTWDVSGQSGAVSAMKGDSVLTHLYIYIVTYIYCSALCGITTILIWMF